MFWQTFYLGVLVVAKSNLFPHNHMPGIGTIQNASMRGLNSLQNARPINWNRTPLCTLLSGSSLAVRLVLAETDAVNMKMVKVEEALLMAMVVMVVAVVLEEC